MKNKAKDKSGWNEPLDSICEGCEKAFIPKKPYYTFCSYQCKMNYTVGYIDNFDVEMMADMMGIFGSEW